MLEGVLAVAKKQYIHRWGLHMAKEHAGQMKVVEGSEEMIKQNTEAIKSSVN